MRRDLDHTLLEKTDRVIRRSLEYAFAHYPELPDYVKEHAQEMDVSVMRKHIDLYVNEFSLSLGKEGRAAVWKMLEIGTSLHPEPIAGTFEVFI